MENPDRDEARDQSFVEGLDFYFEDGAMVLTAHFLRRRGYCCENGCRHCPYGYPNTSLQKEDL